MLKVTLMPTQKEIFTFQAQILLSKLSKVIRLTSSALDQIFWISLQTCVQKLICVLKNNIGKYVMETKLLFFF